MIASSSDVTDHAELYFAQRKHAVNTIRKHADNYGYHAENSVAYLCGNPDMIINVETLLMEAGFPEFHVKKELYWPKGKTATPSGAVPAAASG